MAADGEEVDVLEEVDKERRVNEAIEERGRRVSAGVDEEGGGQTGVRVRRLRVWEQA